MTPMYQLLDGKKLAAPIIDHVTQTIIAEGLEPQLAVILVGNDPASHLYVKLKKKACKDVGITFHQYLLDEDAAEEKVLETIGFLNADTTIDAILIQVPLPGHLDQQKIIDAMDYRKDVDGFHRMNVERYLASKTQRILPGLALAIWTFIAAAGEAAQPGTQVIIIGKSESFTAPTKKLLTDRGFKVTVASPDDADLGAKTRAADVVVTAIGKPKSLTADMIKEGAVVIDIGVNKVNGTTVGDADFENVAPKTSYITPVPGGVGPMTIAMLLTNTMALALNRRLPKL